VNGSLREYNAKRFVLQQHTFIQRTTSFIVCSHSQTPNRTQIGDHEQVDDQENTSFLQHLLLLYGPQVDLYSLAVEPSACAGFTNKQLSVVPKYSCAGFVSVCTANIPSNQYSGFSASCTAQFSNSALQQISAIQLKSFTPEALSAIRSATWSNIPGESCSGLNGNLKWVEGWMFRNYCTMYSIDQGFICHFCTHQSMHQKLAL